MTDLKSNLDVVIESLRKEAIYKIEGLQAHAAALEAELRKIAEVLGTGELTVFDFKNADALHAFDFVVPYKIGPGAQIIASIGGGCGGDTIIRRPLEPGRYRAILQLTKIADEEPRR